MVELESVPAQDTADSDAHMLRALIEKHVHYTGSERARAILGQWPVYLPKFVKVMPIEYRQALQKIAAAKSAQKKLERVSHG